MFISVKTASWSLTPGITLQAVTMLGLFVMTKSRVLLPLVGVVIPAGLDLNHLRDQQIDR